MILPQVHLRNIVYSLSSLLRLTIAVLSKQVISYSLFLNCNTCFQVDRLYIKQLV